jgi:hypothetical protein
VKATFAALLLVAGLSCNRDLSEQHEQLRWALLAPVSRLSCGRRFVPKRNADDMEGSGVCSPDCKAQFTAAYARPLLEGAKGLVGIAPSRDAETEALLVPIRATSREVLDTLGPACADLLAATTEPPPMAAVNPCVEAYAKCSATDRLFRAVNALRTNVMARTGVPLPNPNVSCDPANPTHR